jgi:Na+/H+-dicarboxylate symporter/ABC-type amino acid transport substrate-binding protein
MPNPQPVLRVSPGGQQSTGTEQAAAPAEKRGIHALGLPVWILIGATTGILAGVVFGERTVILRPIGSAYGMMLEGAVYPYLLSSLLYGLGRLAPAMARRLLGASWAVYLFMWSTTFAAIRLLACAIPETPFPTVLTPDTAHRQTSFLHLLIPDNLFEALGQNYVPAVVVFAIVYGVAIQKVQNKSALFEILGAVQAASVTIWGWIVRLAPFGVFALFAAAAGTIEPNQLGGLLLYVGLFLVGTLLLAFVVLPAVLTTVAPVSYRGLLEELQPAFVLALVTTLSVVALPFVQKASERIAAQAGCPESEERTDVIQASLSISYVLAQLGNYFLYLLMMYATFFYKAQLTIAEELLLPFWTLLSGFGSPSATVDGVVFLANSLHLPSPAVLELYLETGTVTRYGQVALSVMGFAFATILVPLVYFRKLRPRPLKALATLAASAALFGSVMLICVTLNPFLSPAAGNPLLSLTLDRRLVQGVKVTLRDATQGDDASIPVGRTPSLLAIQNSGVLRVGYNPDVMPFSYRNDRGELVGYDIAFAYQLARDLDVALELIPFDWQGLSRDLIRQRFDLAMAGTYISDERLQTLTVSHSYYQSPVALIVRSDRASDFLERDAIIGRPNLRLAVFDDPVLVPMVRRLFPGASIEVVPDYRVLPAMKDRIDGAIWTLEQAGAWAAAHPGFTAVAPTDIGSPILFAYLLPPDTSSFRQYLDQWLELKISDGFRAAQLDYWIKGKRRAERPARWNLLDVLLTSHHG